MKLILLPLLATCACSARLDNNYLPPSSARTAGGSGSFLSAPSGGFGGRASAGFGGSAFGGAPLSPSYGAPVTSYSAGAAGGYSSQQANVRILRLDNDNDGTGSYRFNYETENKISQQEQGRLGGGQEPATVVQGSYSYQSPDGQTITVNYVADENGFRPEGAHLPTPPPIPAEIQRSLSGAASFGRTSGFSGSAAGPSNQYLAPAGGNAGYRY